MAGNVIVMSDDNNTNNTLFPGLTVQDGEPYVVLVLDAGDGDEIESVKVPEKVFEAWEEEARTRGIPLKEIILDIILSK